MGRPRKPPAPTSAEPSARNASTFLRWASETGAHGMPIPVELERVGWHRLTEHPLFRGTWLMESAEPGPSPIDPSPLKLAAKSRTS